MRTRLLLTAAVLCLVPGRPGTQGQPQPQVPGVIRSRIILVPVEVRVLDRDGRPVTSLRESDFTVLEDGVPQELAHYSTRIHSALAAGERHIAGSDPSAAAAPMTQRTFLILLGRGRLEVPSRGLTAVKDFVRSLDRPEDRVSVMAYTRVTDATNDRDSVVRLLERYHERHEWIEAYLTSWFSGLMAIYGPRDIPAHIQTRIDDIFDAPDLPPLRDFPVVPPPGDGEFEDARRRLVLAVNPIPTGLPEDSSLLEKQRQDLERLFAAVEYLRYVPGERHLIYVTEEPLHFGELNRLRLTAMANDARISISALQTGGVTFKGWEYARGVSIGRAPPTFYGRSGLQVMALQALRALAEDTGGIASFYQPADKLLRVVEDATRFHYVLGYYPPTPNDGKYHRLNVRVNRGEVDVLHRRGYYARDEFTPTDPKLFQTHSRITAAATYWRDVRDIPVDLAVSSPIGGGVPIRLRIDASRLTVRLDENQHRTSVDVGIFLVAPNGDLAGEERRTVTLALTGDAYARAVAEGICLQVVVPLTAGARLREVRAVAYDYEADRLGTATARAGQSTQAVGCK
jgi:VWFA-related protein